MSASKPPNKRVLLVEDDPSIRTMIQDQLQRLSLDVVVAAEGRTAMGFLANDRFDLICLDLMLPELSGYDLCEYIRKSLKLTVPILMLSGRALPGDRAHAEEVGVTDYLVKPFARAELIKRVRELIDSQ